MRLRPKSRTWNATWRRWTTFSLERVRSSLPPLSSLNSHGICDSVTAPREAALDSKWLMMVSDIGAAKAKAMKLDVGAFEIDDYIARLQHLMGGDEDDEE